MKSKTILFIISLFIFINQNIIAKPVKIFEVDDLSLTGDDRWKRKPLTVLPDDFKERLFESTKYDFKSREDFEASLNMREPSGKKGTAPKLKQVGNFIYNRLLQIGSGDEGVVYLAQHLPTGQYAALKVRGKSSEYEALKRVNRLYGYYSDDEKEGRFYIVSPLVTGVSISKCYINRSWNKFLKETLGVEVSEKKEVSYIKWRNNFAKMHSLLEEAQYLALKGVKADSFNSSDVFVEDNPPQAVCIDLKPCDPIDDKSFESKSGYHWMVNAFFLLGIEKCRSDGNPYKLDESFILPPPIKKLGEKYLEMVSSSSKDQFKYTIKLIKTWLDEAFKEMEAWEASKVQDK